MATYVYEAMNQAGQEVKDELEAASSEDALTKIRSLGYFPTRIREKGGKKKAPAAPGKKKKGGTTLAIGGVSSKLITQFTRQLSTLQDAGLPILRSLNILEQQQRPGLLKNILRGVCEDVEGGATLSEAFAKHPKAFDRLYVNMVAAGETGGVLDVILLRLAEFMEKAQRLKRKVVGAMIYPTCVISFAVLIVTMI
ncbi:MAG: type II secretion system F family protein, partial [Planctomycetota bacterium]